MAGRTYDLRAWKRVRALQLRREPLCRMCLAEDHRTVPAVDVDHIKPIADGGEPLDPTNLRSLCHSHHARVTHAAQHGREPAPKGCTADGMPRDRNHWWHAK